MTGRLKLMRCNRRFYHSLNHCHLNSDQGNTRVNSNSKPIPFGRRTIGDGYPTVIIAEVGVNHEGRPEDCFALIEAAAEAGADAVKLQTILAAENYAPDTESFKVFKQAELQNEDTARAFELARALGMECFSTCADLISFEFIGSLEPVAWKISSGLLTHIPLIRQAAATGRPLLLSTGMTGLAEVSAAANTARLAGADHIGVFQCTSLYPAPPETIHLRAMRTLANELCVEVGLSDHSKGTLAPALAVACGANMIEKHLSLDPSRPGFDHPVSLSPADFKEMVESIRTCELMLGNDAKTVPEVLQKTAHRFLRCLAASRDLKAGHVLTRADVSVLRLTDGHGALPPAALDDVVGKRLSRDVQAHTAIGKDSLS